MPHYLAESFPLIANPREGMERRWQCHGISRNVAGGTTKRTKIGKKVAAYFANGSGRTWKCMAIGGVPLPVSM